MNTTRLKQARSLFLHPHVDRATARHNVRQWVRSLRFLGSKWLLAEHVCKRPASDSLTVVEIRARGAA